MEGAAFHNNDSGITKMSTLVSSQFSALVNSLTGQQLSVMQSVRNGVPLPQNAMLAIGGLVRNGLMAVGTGGNLELTSVGTRIAIV